jgi:hypothetical protein
MNPNIFVHFFSRWPILVTAKIRSLPPLPPTNYNTSGGIWGSNNISNINQQPSCIPTNNVPTNNVPTINDHNNNNNNNNNKP